MAAVPHSSVVDVMGQNSGEWQSHRWLELILCRAGGKMEVMLWLRSRKISPGQDECPCIQSWERPEKTLWRRGLEPGVDVSVGLPTVGIWSWHPPRDHFLPTLLQASSARAMQRHTQEGLISGRTLKLQTTWSWWPLVPCLQREAGTHVHTQTGFRFWKGQQRLA